MTNLKVNVLDVERPLCLYNQNLSVLIFYNPSLFLLCTKIGVENKLEKVTVDEDGKYVSK